MARPTPNHQSPQNRNPLDPHRRCLHHQSCHLYNPRSYTHSRRSLKKCYPQNIESRPHYPPHYYYSHSRYRYPRLIYQVRSLYFPRILLILVVP